MPGTQLGRPPKLTPEVQQEIVRLVAEGNYLKVACEAAGVTFQLIYHYRKKWEAGDPSVTHLDQFFESLKRAVALAEAASVRDIRSGREGWQGQAWFLERRHPKRWAKRPADKTPQSTHVVVQYVDSEPPEAPPRADGGDPPGPAV